MATDSDARRNHIAIKIKAMIEKAPSFTKDECCIYRVPPRLRNLKQDEYTPKIVSIGPLHHHGNTQLVNMEVHKEMCCRKLIERCEADFDDLVTCLLELEPKVRRCYSEKIQLSVEEFVKLILVDCCFVLEYFLTELDDDSQQSKPWLSTDIMFDLILLENQLPFFVFEKVYNLFFEFEMNTGQVPSFMLIASQWFSLYNEEVKEVPPPSGNILHFTDLRRNHFLHPYEKLPVTNEELLTHLYSATQLNDAGVKFSVNEKYKSFLDLDFRGNNLKIPKLTVADKTETELRNLVALEQCHYLKESYITYYVNFLDFLINTDRDVGLLIKRGIIYNWLGDNEEVAKMFNGLCKNVLFEGSSVTYLSIAKQLNDYHDDRCHSKIATLRRDYCNTPWRTVASIAGILLLILTIVQTVCSILQEVQKKG